ncbi:hypothetical protein KGF56_003927 [Candida oxycetoniae]|uniref:ABC1 atypical kinase-like domain-containing protein n=1 Tax=Candida oxycetoniae TaxID=497107 RepID=A0AAI9WWV7_9ASCO|nr:uncharacterized protein KGF56_003927 [Candida oxycetoniae]KAI3403339.2 hypothetical protein KGF56_003927 [Candida oxycetoniae]
MVRLLGHCVSSICKPRPYKPISHLVKCLQCRQQIPYQQVVVATKKYSISTLKSSSPSSSSSSPPSPLSSSSPPPLSSSYSPPKPVKSQKARYFKYKRRFYIGLGLGLAGSILYYSDDRFKHAVQTFDRVGVVSIAMVRCFALYKEVLDSSFDTVADRQKELSKTHKKAAEITLKALEKNGGIYIKLGQHITALTYLLPREWTDTMIPLQDRCPRSSVEEIEKMFESDMGVKLQDIFIEFDPNPIGVASLAQVHIARLRSNGQKVAVKLQHPSLKEFVPIDVEMTKMVFDLMYKAFPEYPLTWLGDEMQNSIYTELDFTKEAENSQRTAEHFEESTFLKIPKIVKAEKRILIMECVSGARLDNLQYLKEHNIDPSKVSACLSHIFNDMIFTPGVALHCDPHGGNLAIRSVDKNNKNNSRYNFEIILYDHGLYRDIPLQMKRDYSHFWLAVLDNDIPQMKKYAKILAGIEGEQKFKIFISAITGRAPDAVLDSRNIKKKRSTEEISEIQSQLNDSQSGVLEDLMEILSSVPRMILLILKTNDLTRNLDESLHTDLGPERTFLIMANYCAKGVYDEGIDTINSRYRGFTWVFKRFTNWIQYCKRLATLYIFDVSLKFHRFRL